METTPKYNFKVELYYTQEVYVIKRDRHLKKTRENISIDEVVKAMPFWRRFGKKRALKLAFKNLEKVKNRQANGG